MRWWYGKLGDLGLWSGTGLGFGPVVEVVLKCFVRGWEVGVVGWSGVCVGKLGV